MSKNKKIFVSMLAVGVAASALAPTAILLSSCQKQVTVKKDGGDKTVKPVTPDQPTPTPTTPVKSEEQKAAELKAAKDEATTVVQNYITTRKTSDFSDLSEAQLSNIKAKIVESLNTATTKDEIVSKSTEALSKTKKLVKNLKTLKATLDSKNDFEESQRFKLSSKTAAKKEYTNAKTKANELLNTEELFALDPQVLADTASNLEKLDKKIQYTVTTDDFEVVNGELKTIFRADLKENVTLPDYVTSISMRLGVTVDPDDPEDSYNTIKTITMPEVTKIGYGAFNGWSTLKTINAPKLKTIDGLAFGGSSIETINADNLEEIGYMAFQKIYKPITITSSKIKNVEPFAFRDSKLSSPLNVSDAYAIMPFAFEDSKVKTTEAEEEHNYAADILASLEELDKQAKAVSLQEIPATYSSENLTTALNAVDSKLKLEKVENYTQRLNDLKAKIEKIKESKRYTNADDQSKKEIFDKYVAIVNSYDQSNKVALLNEKLLEKLEGLSNYFNSLLTFSEETDLYKVEKSKLVLWKKEVPMEELVLPEYITLIPGSTDVSIHKIPKITGLGILVLDRGAFSYAKDVVEFNFPEALAALVGAITSSDSLTIIKVPKVELIANGSMRTNHKLSEVDATNAKKIYFDAFRDDDVLRTVKVADKANLVINGDPFGNSSVTEGNPLTLEKFLSDNN